MFKLKLGVDFYQLLFNYLFLFLEKGRVAQRTVSDPGPDPRTRLLPRAPVHAGLWAMAQPGAEAGTCHQLYASVLGPFPSMDPEGRAEPAAESWGLCQDLSRSHGSVPSRPLCCGPCCL